MTKRMTQRTTVGVAGLLLASWLLSNPLSACLGQSQPDAPKPRSTASSVPIGAVTELQQRIDRGELELDYEPGSGYLRAVLEALGIPVESQVLVFSKTSCQRDKISPDAPRAIYFNEAAYVAWIPTSGLLEISQVVPGAGAVFHTLDQGEQAARPQLVRRDQCLECHTSMQTGNVPGYLVRSYVTDSHGVIDITEGVSMIDHRTPFAQRWGGWYLSGSTGNVPHRGRILAPDASSGDASAATVPAQYPVGSSDIVSLLVLEHQAAMQNLLTSLYQAAAATQSRAAAAELWKPRAEAVLRYMLFLDEAPLPGPMAGASSFAAGFQQRGPVDGRGRSLRQFDLQSRLFKYPCSYMIYSDSFDVLPRETKLHLYRRLWTWLNGEDAEAPDGGRKSADTEASKQAIREILLETKGDLPVYWRLGEP